MIDRKEQEYLRGKFNPDGSSLRKQQMVMLDMLKKFDTFCKENDITYWITAGTLLGAVRHGGFIPWDDDLDIDMFSCDYKKLLKNRDGLKKLGMVLQDFHSDKEYIAPYAKLRDLNSLLSEVNHYDTYYKYKGIYIDIFVRIRVSETISKISGKLQVCCYKISDIKQHVARRFLKWILYYTLHVVIYPLLLGIDKCLYFQNKRRYPLGSCFYDTIEKNHVIPTGNISFENYLFPAPKIIDKFLRDKYGDYNKLPAINDLHPHYEEIIFL